MAARAIFASNCAECVFRSTVVVLLVRVVRRSSIPCPGFGVHYRSIIDFDPASDAFLTAL